MSFVSYAQNFEDVMLWRALKHVQNGLYVDVGAQHPIIDSVSKAFYENGWRGIHIEPVHYYAQLLRQDRPDEVVLEVALSDTEGTLELNVIAETGLSTAVDAYAQLHHNERGFDFQSIQVATLTLKSALRPFEGKDVHWLKIDVEGFEENVLKEWDSQALRPWVMVIEATSPGSSQANYLSWDPLLTAADYQFVYFDGLNRFYVAKEHIELAEAFSCPPNVFDDIELSGLASWGLCRGLIASHKEKEKELTSQIEANEVKAQQAEAKVQQLHNQLIAIYQSTSWYFTKPLRVFKAVSTGSFLVIRQVIRSAEVQVKIKLQPLLAALIKVFFDNEKSRAHLSPWIKRLPWLRQRLIKVGVNTGVVPPLARNFVSSQQPNSRQKAAVPRELCDLTPRARRIYLDLKVAINHQNREHGKCVL